MAARTILSRNLQPLKADQVLPIAYKWAEALEGRELEYRFDPPLAEGWGAEWAQMTPADYPADTLDGIEVNAEWMGEAWAFEVIEYQAGTDGSELHVFKVYSRLGDAINLVEKMARTGKKPKPEKIWK